MRVFTAALWNETNAFAPFPVDLGSFPVKMAWHVRYRHDPAHRWLRALVGQVIGDLAGGTSTPAAEPAS